MLKEIRCPLCNSEALTILNTDDSTKRMRLVCEECNAFCTVYFEFVTAPKPAINTNEAKLRERLNQSISYVEKTLETRLR